MESFKIKDIVKIINGSNHPKLYSLIGMCKYIIGDDFIYSEEKIYIKNLYNFTNRQCELKDIEIYIVFENKFYVIKYIEEKKYIGRSYLKSYNLKDIEIVELKEYKKYSEIYLDLNIKFKSNDSYTLNNLKDTYEEILSKEYGEVIIDIFKKLK